METSDIIFICAMFAALVVWIVILYHARHADAERFADKIVKYEMNREQFERENDALNRKVSVLQDRLITAEGLQSELASTRQQLQDACAAASRVIIPPTAEELENAKSRAAEAERKLEQARKRNQNLNYEKKEFKALFENRDAVVTALKSQRQSIDDLYRRAAQSALRKTYIQNTFLCRSFTHATLDACAEKIASAADERIEILPSTHLCFEIRGASGAVYRTTLNDCTCPDFRHRHQPCKHMYRIALELGLLSDLGAQARACVIADAAETVKNKSAEKRS